MAGPDLDVVVVGDGPAGLALGAACRRAGLSTVVCGLGAPWTATYGTWRDDVADVPDRCFAVVAPRVVVHGHRRHVIERPYGVFDNAALRAHLADGLDVRVGEGLRAQHFEWGSRLLTDRRRVRRPARRRGHGVPADARPGATAGRPPDGVRRRRRRAAAGVRATTTWC